MDCSAEYSLACLILEKKKAVLAALLLEEEEDAERKRKQRLQIPRSVWNISTEDDATDADFEVSELVGKIFPSQSSQNKQWAINIVCSALDTATKSISNDALDSSTFKDFEVSVSDEGVVKKGEVFSSRFMGLVASRIHRVCEESTKHSPRS
jgi:hypothetical protein